MFDFRKTFKLSAFIIVANACFGTQVFAASKYAGTVNYFDIHSVNPDKVTDADCQKAYGRSERVVLSDKGLPTGRNAKYLVTAEAGHGAPEKTYMSIIRTDEKRTIAGKKYDLATISAVTAENGLKEASGLISNTACAGRFEFHADSKKRARDLNS